MANENKISISAITDWRAGEIITDTKLKAVFDLIGTVVNNLDDKTWILQQQVNNLQVAARWIGQVQTYSQIPNLINSLKDNNKYQPPNLPVPSSGDTILVKNNRDDARYPELDKGSYIYVYLVNSITNEGSWEIYVPFGTPVASEINDGIMSSTDYTKLKSLPTGRNLNNKLNEIQQITENNMRLVNQNTRQLNDHSDKLIQLENKSNILNTTKQPKITNITGLKTSTVEDNLSEINNRLKAIESYDSQIFYASEEYDWLSISDLRQDYASKMWYKDLILPIESSEKIIPGCNIKITFKTEIQTQDMLRKHTSATICYIPVEVIYYEHQQLEDNSDFRLKGGNYLVLEDGYKIYVKLWKDELSSYVVRLLADENFPSTYASQKISIEHIVKDMGHSDYALSDYMLKQLGQWVKDNKKITSFTIYNNIQEDSFNGFRTNDIFNLGVDFVYGAGSLFISCGGVLLTEHQDYEEVENGANPLTSTIRFLRDFDLNINGGMTFKIISIGFDTYHFAPWNSSTWYRIGEAVFENFKVYIAKNGNINKRPSSNPDYWSDFELKVNINDFQNKVDNIINDVASRHVKKHLETKKVGDVRVKIQDTYEIYANENAFLRELNKLLNAACYYNISTYKYQIEPHNKDNFALHISDNNNEYKVKWLYDVFQPVLANNLIVDGTKLVNRTIGIRQLLYVKHTSLTLNNEQALINFINHLRNLGAPIPSYSSNNLENEWYKINKELYKYKNQVVLFAEGEAYAQFRDENLDSGETVTYLHDGRYLMAGGKMLSESDATGGSNFLKQSDLPKVDLSHSHQIYIAGDGGGLWTSIVGSGSPWVGITGSRIDAYQHWNEEYIARASLHLNPYTQTEFQPKYYKLVACYPNQNMHKKTRVITFKQDIYVNTSAVIR